jgi:tripartite-type tricarboxylate transporter receptor subunit TctC
MLFRLSILFSTFAFICSVHAQNFPDKPIRIVVPFAPGGGTDVVARAIAPKMSELLGVPVVIVNQPGAGGSTGTEIVSRAPADGYTILLVSSSTAINHTLDKNISWSLSKDFAPIVLILYNQSFLVAHPSVPVNTVAELLALAKKEPKLLSYASAGPGSSSHLGMELFKMMSNAEILHVPYKGAGPAMNDLVGGQVNVMLSDISVILPQVKAGKVKVLGIGSPQRFSATPEVPTISEAGITGFEVSGIIGFVAPTGTPAIAIQKINAAANEAIKDPVIRERLLSLAMVIMGGTPERLADVLQKEIKKWADVIASAKLKN